MSDDTTDTDDATEFLRAAIPTGAAIEFTPGRIELARGNLRGYGSRLKAPLSNRKDRTHRSDDSIQGRIKHWYHGLKDDLRHSVREHTERRLINHWSRPVLIVLLWALGVLGLVIWHVLTTSWPRPTALTQALPLPNGPVGALLRIIFQSSLAVVTLEFTSWYEFITGRNVLVYGGLLTVGLWRVIHIQVRNPTGKRRLVVTLVSGSDETVRMFYEVAGEGPLDRALDRVRHELTRVYNDMCQFTEVNDGETSLADVVAETARPVEAARLAVKEDAVRDILRHDKPVAETLSRPVTQTEQRTEEAALPLDQFVTTLSEMDRPAVVQVVVSPRRHGDAYVQDKMRLAGEVTDQPPMLRLLALVANRIVATGKFLGDFSESASEDDNEESREPVRVDERRVVAGDSQQEDEHDPFPGLDGCDHTPIYDVNIRTVALGDPTAPAAPAGTGRNLIQDRIADVIGETMRESTREVSVASAKTRDDQVDIAADIDAGAINYDVPYGALGWRVTERRNGAADRQNLAAYTLISGAGSAEAQRALGMLRREEWGRGRDSRFTTEAHDDD